MTTIRAGLYGLITTDALGVPAESRTREDLSRNPITGNILGAYLGLVGIPEKFTENLELMDVLLELADDLYYDCQLDAHTHPTDPRDLAWEKKYVCIAYPEKKKDWNLKK